MKDLGHLLRLADPLRHEPVRFDDERARIRSTVLDSLRSAPSHPRRALHFAPLLAAGLLIAMALAYWTGTLRVTPVIAQVRFELRLAEDQPVPGLVVSRVQASDRLIYLHPEAVVEAVAEAEAVHRVNLRAEARINLAIQALSVDVLKAINNSAKLARAIPSVLRISSCASRHHGGGRGGAQKCFFHYRSPCPKALPGRRESAGA